MTASSSLKFRPIDAVEDTFERWLEDQMKERGMDAKDLQAALLLPTAKKAARIINGTDLPILTTPQVADLAALFNVDPFNLHMRYGLGENAMIIGDFKRLILWANGYKLSREMNVA